MNRTQQNDIGTILHSRDLIAPNRFNGNQNGTLTRRFELDADIIQFLNGSDAATLTYLSEYTHLNSLRAHFKQYAADKPEHEVNTIVLRLDGQDIVATYLMAYPTYQWLDVDQDKPTVNVDYPFQAVQNGDVDPKDIRTITNFWFVNPDGKRNGPTIDKLTVDYVFTDADNKSLLKLATDFARELTRRALSDDVLTTIGRVGFIEFGNICKWGAYLSMKLGETPFVKSMWAPFLNNTTPREFESKIQLITLAQKSINEQVQAIEQTENITPFKIIPFAQMRKDAQPHFLNAFKNFCFSRFFHSRFNVNIELFTMFRLAPFPAPMPVTRLTLAAPKTDNSMEF